MSRTLNHLEEPKVISDSHPSSRLRLVVDNSESIDLKDVKETERKKKERFQVIGLVLLLVPTLTYTFSRFLALRRAFQDKPLIPTTRSETAEQGSALENHVAQNRVATRLFYSGDLEGASSTLKKLIQEDGENPIFYANLAVVRHRQGKSEDARKLFKTALQKEKRSPAPYVLAMALNGLAVLELEASSEIDESEDSEIQALFHRAIAVSSQSAEPYLNLAKLLELEGKWKDAAHFYSEFLKNAVADSEVKAIIDKRLNKIEQGIR